jgi:hypothetical protein
LPPVSRRLCRLPRVIPMLLLLLLSAAGAHDLRAGASAKPLRRDRRLCLSLPREPTAQPGTRAAHGVWAAQAGGLARQPTTASTEPQPGARGSRGWRTREDDRLRGGGAILGKGVAPRRSPLTCPQSAKGSSPTDAGLICLRCAWTRRPTWDKWCVPPRGEPLVAWRHPPTPHVARAALQVNIAPQTRKERRSQVYREDLEKSRLRARREGFAHYEVRARAAASARRNHCRCCRCHPLRALGLCVGCRRAA